MGFSITHLAGAAAVAAALPILYFLHRNRHQRHLKGERVLILGASSGVGHAIARRYAQRGARVCVVARRADKIKALQDEIECGRGTSSSSSSCLGQVADMTVVADMVRVREAIEAAWGGLDTMHVCAGVSALQPLMALTDSSSMQMGSPGLQDATRTGIQTATDIAGRAVQGNFNGPLVAALTFVRSLFMFCSPVLTLHRPSINGAVCGRTIRR